MDPREGDLGFLRIVVNAISGPEAKSLADIRVTEINERFKRHLNERGLSRWWENGGWQYPEKVLFRLRTRTLRKLDYDPMSDEENEAMMQLFTRSTQTNIQTDTQGVQST
jgi:hypothetical protein